MTRMSQQLASAIRRAMSNKGDGEREAALTMGVSQGALQGWLKGGGVLNRNRPAIATYLGVTTEAVDALIAGEEPEGRRDTDILASLVDLYGKQQTTEGYLAELTRRQLVADARLRELGDEVTKMQKAILDAKREVNALRRRLNGG